ncbi:hypothetical protein [Paenibacillus naphthalenovorans]|uniref:hypothetical protein n=1 Tax=Paenibacillus naphthalenovorans TaxID=162209 RepID=UPI003D27FA6A
MSRRNNRIASLFLTAVLLTTTVFGSIPFVAQPNVAHATAEEDALYGPKSMQNPNKVTVIAEKERYL